MPDANYKIGDHEFIRLDGMPLGPAGVVDFETRPGQSQHAIWITAEIGMPQELESLVDAEDLDKAKDYLAKYRELMAGDPVAVRWGGEELDFDIKVLDVQPAGPRAIRAIVIGVGGINGTPQTPARAMLQCRWQVLPVPKPEPPEAEAEAEP